MTAAPPIPVLKPAPRVSAALPEPAAGEVRRRLSVGEMTCASCALRVEDALTKVPGVRGARVNLATETADLVLASGTGQAALADALSAAGYRLRDEPAATVAGDPAAAAPDREGPARARALLALALAAPVAVADMAGHAVPAVHHLLASALGADGLAFAKAALTTAVLAGPGRSIFVTGFRRLRALSPDMNALVAIGAGTAWAWSLLAWLRPGLLPEGAAYLYFETAAVIVALVLLGRWLETRAKGRAAQAIRGLLDLQPARVRVLRGGTPQEIALDDLGIGDEIDLRPGERVPADGVVTDGAGFVNEAMLTGEPVAVAKSPGDRVTAGSVNQSGPLRVRADAVGTGTRLHRIVKMVEDAQAARLPVQAQVDRVTRVFVPAILAIAALTALVWTLAGAPDRAAVHAIAVLIVACPCAMGLATPVSILVATGRAASLGLLFRRGDALETLAAIDTLALDKTGTLTEGRPAVAEMVVLEGDLRDILAAAAALEARSEHPLGRALVAAAEAEGIAPGEASDVRVRTGGGIAGQVRGREVVIGSPEYLARAGLWSPDGDAALQRLTGAAQTPVGIALGGRLAALVGLHDPVRPEAGAAIAALQKAGVGVRMLTGDAEAPAQAVAGKLGVEAVHARLDPEGKARLVGEWREGGAAVAFAGDGINDAPALSRATVGIAIAGTTDIAVEAADVVVLRPDLGLLPVAVALSRATLRNIRQNLVWAFGYNVALIPLAAGLFVPVFGWSLSPVLAAAAMAASSLFVLANALRLRRFGGALP